MKQFRCLALAVIIFCLTIVAFDVSVRHFRYSMLYARGKRPQHSCQSIHSVMLPSHSSRQSVSFTLLQSCCRIHPSSSLPPSPSLPLFLPPYPSLHPSVPPSLSLPPFLPPSLPPSPLHTTHSRCRRTRTALACRNARDAVVADEAGKAVWEGRPAGWGGLQGGGGPGGVAGRVG